MPRLSSKSYLATRRSLRAARQWRDVLSPDDIIAVARFFAPTNPLTDAEALAHRRAVTLADPSLPNRVGKILKKLDRTTSPLERQVSRVVGAVEPDPTVFGKPGKEKRVVVTAVRNDTIDLRKLMFVYRGWLKTRADDQDKAA